MRLAIISWVSLALALALSPWATAQAPRPTRLASNSQGQLEPLIEAIRGVQAEGKGHREAMAAWQQLTAKAGAESLPTILAGMDGAGPLAENWLRAAVDTIAERQVQQTGKLPQASLEKFLAQTQHNPRARRLTYEWIAKVDSTAADRLIPGMLEDPSLELRRDAVALLVAAAEKSATEKPEDAKNTYRKALNSARDLDQVKAITEALAKLGAPVDLQHHYGFLVDWQLIGPFDNRGGKGYKAVYPPEEGIDLAGKYEGLEGEVAWKPHHTDDEYGTVDLNKAIAKHMGAVGYAVAVFQSDREQPVELRLGSENANKIWLNGKLLYETEVYHANSAIDQYVGRGTLKKGQNVIVLKICQDEQTVDWAQSWSFQLRVCDASGKAVLAADRGPANPKPKQPAAEATAG
jgi:hypothetical protein